MSGTGQSAAGPGRAALSVLRALVARPDLWATALRQARRVVGPGWWRRRPFLPLPPPSYVHFRLVTAYGGRGTLAEAVGSEGEAGAARDVVAYLEWCRQWRAMTRHRSA